MKTEAFHLGDFSDEAGYSVLREASFSQIGFTEIGDDTKIGGFAYVAHCARVGRRCRFMTRSIVCGTALIGDDAVVGVGAIVSNGISIGRGATVMISEHLRSDLPEGMLLMQGRFIDQRKFARMRALAG